MRGRSQDFENKTFEVLAKQCNLEGNIRTVFSVVQNFYESAQGQRKSNKSLILKN